MSFLVFLRPVREQMPFEPTDEETRVVSERYAYLQQEARAIVDADPAVVTGTMTAEIRPMRIAVR